MTQRLRSPRNLTPPNGRPTKRQAEERYEELLDRALDMFLERGFELTTMEAVAASIRMTKRTVYSRYEDKRALFRAAVRRAIDRWIAPIDALEAAVTEDLEASLLAIARIRVAITLTPAGLRLQRIINAESFRFPEILQNYEEAVTPAINFMAELFRRHEGGELGKLEDPEFAARAFLTIAGSPSRLVVLGKPADKVAIDEFTQKFVRLFLNGLRRG